MTSSSGPHRCGTTSLAWRSVHGCRRGEALKRIGASHVALVGALGPASAIMLGHIGFSVAFTWVQVGAILPILAGVVLVNAASVPRPAPVASPD
uniref:EamA family transporter n=1 Tax=Azospirillum canadense TaxID=403962 RepID=UPI0038739B84